MVLRTLPVRFTEPHPEGAEYLVTPIPLPTRWNWFVNGFRRYVRGYVRKHFHAVRVSKSGHTLPTDGGPVLVAMNHPSWWDPLIGAVLLDLLPAHAHYGAIDAGMLKKYPAFDKLGFFGVNQTSLRGAADFLKTGAAILSGDGRAVWVTAQGEFADARKRPLNLKSGVGHLAARMTTGWVVPIAVEYAFWTERTPEALVRVGEPLRIAPLSPGGRGAGGEGGRTWTAKIEAALSSTLDGLNAEVAARDPNRFTVLLGGKAGVGGFYDAVRRSIAWATGKKFDAAHMAAAEKPV